MPINPISNITKVFQLISSSQNIIDSTYYQRTINKITAQSSYTSSISLNSLTCKPTIMQRVKKSLSLFETPPKTDTKKQDKQLWLPDHLSGKILDLQFECQTQNLSRQVIDQLVKCYSKAVEFYNERGNYKYKIYQRRMQMFLAKPKIEEILKGKTAKIIMAKQNTQQSLKNAQSNTKKTIEQIISQSEKTSLQAYHKIKTDLQKQEDKLEQRIRKKRTMSNKSTKTEENKDDEFGRGAIGQKMSMKFLLDGINQRHKKVFF